MDVESILLNMTDTVFFALLSLFFAGINDVVFKKYSMENLSKGMNIFSIGVVWTLLQLIAFKYKGIHIAFDCSTLCYGLIAGVFLTLSNLLLLESLSKIDVSLGSTIYRLNSIGVVVFSFMFLNEPLSFFKAMGIIMGVLGAFALYQKKGNGQYTQYSIIFLSIAIAASFLRAGYGVVCKAGLVHHAQPQTMLLIASLSWIVGGWGYAVFREKRFGITRKMVGYGVISGVFAFLIVNSLLLAIEYGQASIAIPIANMSFVVALFLSAALQMESLTIRKCGAILCAAGSIVFLSVA